MREDVEQKNKAPRHFSVAGATSRLSTWAGLAFRRALPLVAVALMICSITGLPDSSVFSSRKSPSEYSSRQRNRDAQLDEDLENAEPALLHTHGSATSGGASRGVEDGNGGTPLGEGGAIVRKGGGKGTAPGVGDRVKDNSSSLAGAVVDSDQGEGKRGSASDVAVPINGTTFNGGADGEQGDPDSWKYWLLPSDGSEFLCEVRDSGLAKVLIWGDENLQPSAHECAASCRATEGCTAWTWCKDPEKLSCFDLQSESWLNWHGCKLMDIPQLPIDTPTDRQKMSDAAYFRSHATGFITRNLYARPPSVIVATAFQRCARGDWDTEQHDWSNYLSWLSLYNKLNFARLHASSLHIFALWDMVTIKTELMTQLLEETADDPYAEWVLWADLRSMITNPAFTFPIVKNYESGRGAELTIFGNEDGVMGGDSWKMDTGVMLMKNTQWTRSFWAQATAALRDPGRMEKILAHDTDLHGTHTGGLTNGTSLEQAIMYLLIKDLENNLPKVYFERSFCLSCFWRRHNMRAPTSYISHFAAVPCCGEYALEKNELYYESFMQQYNISRCYFMKALGRSEQPLALTQNGSVPALSTGLTLTTLENHMIAIPATNLQESAARCRASCSETSGCNAWIWCWREGSCDDGKDWNPTLWPFKACGLYILPPNQPLQPAGRGPHFSSYSQGFFTESEVLLPDPEADLEPNSDPDLKAVVSTRALRVASWDGLLSRFGKSEGSRAVPRSPRPPGRPNVAITTAIPPNPCSFPIADHFNTLALSSKQDYALLHGLELHLSAQNVDPGVTGHFNKIAWIRRMLMESPREDVEWVMWMDMDTLMADQAFELPWARYEGADMVVWGVKERVQEGEVEGINTGVMLFRNTAWSLAFLDELYGYALMGEEALQDMRQVLEEEIHPLVPGFKDTPFILYLLKSQAKYLDKVYFEQEASLNRHWLQVEWDKKEVPLVAHYAGCTVCNPPEGKLSEEVIMACNQEFAKAYAFGRCQLLSNYTGADASTQCRYPAVDMSHISIRLGV